MDKKYSKKVSRLRGFLYGEPSILVFREILSILNEIKDKELLAIGLEYAKAHLQHWPYWYRCARIEHFWPSFPEGSPFPSFYLVGKLNLLDEGIDDHGFEIITKQPHFRCLRSLDLRWNNITSLGISSFLDSLGAEKSLISLKLGHNPVGDEGVRDLCNSYNLQNLMKLDIKRCGVSNLGLEYLSKSRFLNKIIWLVASMNSFDDSGVVGIANSKNLSSLEELHLGWHDLTHHGIVAISNSNILRNLKVLSLCHTVYQSGRSFRYNQEYQDFEDALVELFNSKNVQQLHDVRVCGGNFNVRFFERIDGTILGKKNGRFYCPGANIYSDVDGRHRGRIKSESEKGEDKFPFCQLKRCDCIL